MADESRAKLQELVEKELEIINSGDVDRFEEVYAHDFIHHGFETKGLDEYKKVLNMAKSAFPDVTSKIEDMIIEKNKVVTRLTGKGTHKGIYHGLPNREYGIPPTGKTFEADAIEIMRIENGKIKEMWTLLDHVSLLEQLGVEFTHGG